jgi:hypothetical protein
MSNRDDPTLFEQILEHRLGAEQVARIDGRDEGRRVAEPHAGGNWCPVLTLLDVAFQGIAA